jgi:signal transduction histidine kinase/CheY-like chemotaxis protein
MRKILTVLILLIGACSVSLFANEQALNELREKANQSTGQVKVDALNELARMLHKTEPQEAYKYSLEAYELSEKRSYAAGLAQAADNLGVSMLERYDYENAMRYFVEGLSIRNAEKDKAGIATSKNYIGRVFYLQEDMNSAMDNLQVALDIRNQLTDFAGAAETHEYIGEVYLFKKTYGEARQNFEQAMQLRIEMEQLPEAARLASQLGKISSEMGDSDSAIAYFSQSLDLNSTMQAIEKIAEDYNNIALVFYNQALTRSFEKEELLEEALDANESAFQIRSSLNDKLALAESLQNFGSIYTELGDKAQALEALGQSAALLKDIGSEPGVQFIYEQISKAYESLGDFKNAYKYQLLYAKTKEVLFNKEKSTALLELTTKYDSQFAAQKQKQKIAVLEKEQTFDQKIRWFLMALVALGLLLMGVLYNNYQSKKKDNNLLRAKNEEIERQKSEINKKNEELNKINESLDVLNQKLVTEMAERESIEQSSFARDRFLATMSHEMRTPMNIIIGLTHLLLSEQPREDQIEHLRTLQFSANNLVVFINDVLDFSKIEAGKLTLESRAFKPKELINEVRKRFELPSRDKNIAISCELDKSVPDVLLGDSARLNQIMTNLVSNAIKYTDDGSVDIHVQLHELTKKEAVLKLIVEDTGNGIDPAKLEEMFRKFSSQSNEELFEGYASSGLGLAITKRLVDLQNGKIEVESIPDQGTKFTILLPFRTIDASKYVENKNDGPKDYSHLSENKVLLVEDNKINQLVVAKMLRKLGMEVVTADDGLEALEAYSMQYFDLVLMDIQMPKMDGYRTTAEIRKSTDPRKRDVPIIALTASAFLTEKEKAKLFGMNDHVGKPFGPDDLLEKISNCLAVYKA